MSMLSIELLHRGRVVALSTQRALAALLAVAGIAVAEASLLAAAPATPAWPAAVLLVAAVGAAMLPDSSLGLPTLGGYAGWWLLVVPDELTGWSLPAALGLLLFHASLAFAAAGPATVVAERAVLLRWVRDLVPPAAVTAGVWLLPQVVRPGAVPALMLGATLLLAGAGLLALTRPRDGLRVESE